MTEEDAKTKWCPFSRVIAGSRGTRGNMSAVPGVLPHNRVQEANETEATWHGSMCCLGSNCMMWVAQEKYVTDGLVERYEQTGRGDCGLKDGRNVNL